MAATALATVMSPAVATAVTVVILLSMFSATSSVILTAPRVCFAMARDRLFFSAFADVHPRFGTPAWTVGLAIVLAGAPAYLIWRGRNRTTPEDGRRRR